MFEITWRHISIIWQLTVLKKIPQDLCLITVSRETVKDEWDLKFIDEVIEKEIEDQERDAVGSSANTRRPPALLTNKSTGLLCSCNLLKLKCVGKMDDLPQLTYFIVEAKDHTLQAEFETFLPFNTTDREGGDQDLWLQSFVEVSLDIGTLIGTDHCWLLVTGKICQEETGSSVIETKLGKDKSTTQLQIVYDPSSEPSLNDCLYVGPVFRQHILHILIRFRLHKIALIAYIQKALMMLSVTEEDRDVLRFLWINDINNELLKIQVLWFASVVFKSIYP
ncbi:hypothetical protein EMCRGX_G016884 [Ephydatia muelleri]